MSSPFIFFSDVDQYPVWILSTTSSGAPTSVFQGDLLWWNPCIVRYECDNSFEVVEAPESRLKPKTGDDEPTPWGTVSWESIQNQCFRGDPRRLARYRDQGRPAQAADVPGSSARVAEKKEVPIIEESPPPEPANPNQEISEPPAKKAKKETPKAPEVAIREPVKIISSSSPIELLSTYAAGGSAIFSDTLEKKSSPFLSSSPFSEDIVKATIAIESYQPVSTKDSYKAAVAKFLDYIKVAEVDDKAFIDPSLTEQIMVGFFVSRIGRVPQLTAKLHWRDVAPATAKTEVSAVIATEIAWLATIILGPAHCLQKVRSTQKGPSLRKIASVCQQPRSNVALSPRNEDRGHQCPKLRSVRHHLLLHASRGRVSHAAQKPAGAPKNTRASNLEGHTGPFQIRPFSPWKTSPWWLLDWILFQRFLL